MPHRQLPNKEDPIWLFPTCLVETFHPEVGLAAVELIERAGYRVDVPPKLTCCGQPAYNAGSWDEAKEVARYTLKRLETLPGTIVIPSGSCADMLIHQTLELFRGDETWRPRAHSVAERCYELSEFLGSLQPQKASYQGRVAYHPSCHLSRGLGVQKEPTRLLESLDGAEAVSFDDQDECCGFGGMFSVKQSTLSGAMLNKKLQSIDESDADVLVSCDLGCLLHLGGAMHRRQSKTRACHLAVLLNEAQKRAEG